MVRIYGDVWAVFLPLHHQAERHGCHPALQLHPTAALMVHDCNTSLSPRGALPPTVLVKALSPSLSLFFFNYPMFQVCRWRTTSRAQAGAQPSLLPYPCQD